MLQRHDEQMYVCLTLELPRDSVENIESVVIGVGDVLLTVVRVTKKYLGSASPPVAFPGSAQGWYLGCQATGELIQGAYEMTARWFKTFKCCVDRSRKQINYTVNPP